MKRIYLSVAGLWLLAACQGFQTQATAGLGSIEQVIAGEIAATAKFYEDSFQNVPFADGPVTVLAEVNGALQSHTLMSCHNRTRVCGDRTGILQRSYRHYVVSGAVSSGAVFYLSPGGDGHLVQGGKTIPLAWN
jgi:hypothetical protein